MLDGHQGAVRRVDEGFNFGRRQGWGEEIALTISAAGIAEDLKLFFGFDAFGDDIHPEDAGELDDGLDDLEGLATALESLDE